MSRYVNYVVWLGFLLFLGATPALANTTNLSFDPALGTQPFSFYCQPYIMSFETGKHYVAQNGGRCFFTMPNSVVGNKFVSIFKGVPGNSTLVVTDPVTGAALNGNPPTLVQEDNTPSFGTPSQDQDYFGVVYGGTAEQAQFQAAFSTGSSTNTLLPSDNYKLIQWKWGSKPVAEYEPVIIIPGIIGSWEKNGEWIIDPILHTYDNLVDTFLANGYVEGKTLFKFGYDWEDANNLTAHLLANKIKSIKQICGCSHVDIIAHSMGGLVASYYIENSEYQNDVDQLFLVATPLSGSPKAYKTWENGEIDLGGIQSNLIMRAIFKKEATKNGFASIFDYIRLKPIESIHDLLPVYNYLYSDSIGELQYPTGYPVNGFLETLLIDFINVYKKVRVNTILADNLLTNTIGAFLVQPSTRLPKWEHGEPINAMYENGDDTVPRSSIENAVPVVDREFDGVDHLSVVSTTTSYIFKQLNNRAPNPVINIDRPINFGFLIINLFSPIDMQIIAPDGKRLGKDFITNSELNEIPNAFYSGFNTDNEYAVLVNPLPGTYSVKTIGTGSGGTYTIVTDYINNSATTEAEVTGSTTPSQIIGHAVVLSSTTTAVTITFETPPPVTLTPDTCIVDMKQAYQNKWIGRKIVYDGIVFDCKTLKMLFQTRDSIEKTSLANRTKKQNQLLTLTLGAIKLILDNMDLWAKDKDNTKEGVELIHKYTTWFRSH